MKSFACPHNKTVTILQRCPIEECPFHAERVGKLFTMECKTGCVFYDTNLISDETPSRTQISALSRDPSRLLAPSAIRGIYADMLRNAETLHALTHDVVRYTHCSCCGYPRRECTSTTVCSERDEWVTGVLTNVFKVQRINSNYKAIIWQRLLDKTLHLDAAIVKNGFELCLASDIPKTD